ALKKPVKIKQLPDQPGDVMVTYADISRARKELGYDPGVSIQEGIPMFVNWYTRQQDLKD
ncbi:epimerase, partial [bacterium]|nr:epimerase [bacterium]